MIYKLYRDDYNINFENLKIEEAGIDDAKEILALQKAVYVSEAEIINDFSIQPLTQTLDEIIEELRDQLVLKAIIVNDNNEEKTCGAGKNGRIIGSVRGYQKNGTSYIGKLIVDPEYQSLGIGRELMSLIERRFFKTSRFELFTGSRSEKNIRLYKRLGYKPFRTEKVSETLSLVFMEKVVWE